MRRIARRSRGQAAVLMVLLMVAVMTGAALTIDVGAAYAYKQRCESVVEAAALAAANYLPNRYRAANAANEIVAANGLTLENVIVTTPYNGSVSKVQVSYGDQQPTYFGRTLGINLFQINAQAVATHGGPAVFDFAIFSGSDLEWLDMTGSTVVVNGHVHGNEDIRIRGADVDVSGQVEAVGTVDVRGSDFVAGSVLSAAPRVAMPTYDVNVLRAACATRYIGSQHWSGITINVDGGVFVEGDLKLSGCSITGTGCLVVTGNVELAGTGLYYTNPATDNLCVYGLKDIHVTGTDFVADGIIYAPTGTIDTSGASFTVNGSMVADMVDFAGVDIYVNHDVDAKSAFFGGYSALTR